ncbi:preprotein translocase subunit YajC [Streptococcaceae bacterium ESL0687]|nr:preprotein translocase subunit YajC [Streptococcaceae bacterium ESL0687]
MGSPFILVMLVMVGGMMFMTSRQQKKAQESRKNLLDSMKIGSSIVTIGGLHGTLFAVNDDLGTIELDCEGVILTFDKSAIKTVKEPAQVQAEAEKFVADSEEKADQESQRPYDTPIEEDK